jgi:hypothetical protein
MTPEKGVNLDVMRDDEAAKNPFFEEEVSGSSNCFCPAFPDQMTDNIPGTCILHQVFPKEQPRRADELVPHAPCQLRGRARAS